MIKKLFQIEQGQKIINIDSNSDLHIMYPDGDKSVYFYLKNHIDFSYKFLIEWSGNKWNVNPHNKENADVFFLLMKKYPQVYKNFIKKIVSDKNAPKV